MGEKSSKEKAQKKSWFKGLKAEFKKIIWRIRRHLQKKQQQLLLFHYCWQH